MDFSKLLVLSLGTGSSKRDEKLEVRDGKSWGLFSWFMGPNGTNPLFDVVLTAMDDMVDIYLSVFFHGSNFKDNYLRIQIDSLKYTQAATDNSNEENLQNLEKIANELLKMPVAAVNLETGLYEPIEEADTYEEAIIKLIFHQIYLPFDLSSNLHLSFKMDFKLACTHQHSLTYLYGGGRLSEVCGNKYSLVRPVLVQGARFGCIVHAPPKYCSSNYRTSPEFK